MVSILSFLAGFPKLCKHENWPIHVQHETVLALIPHRNVCTHSVLTQAATYREWQNSKEESKFLEKQK